MTADLTRRRLLGIGAAALVGSSVSGLAAACSARPASSTTRRGGSPPSPGAGPAGPSLAAAVTDERALIAGYDELLPLASGPDRRMLERLRAQHEAHLARLAPGPAGSVGVRRIGVAAQLARQEAASSHRLSRAATAASEADAAALLASIAASHAGHAQLLQGVRLPVTNRGAPPPRRRR